MLACTTQLEGENNVLMSASWSPRVTMAKERGTRDEVQIAKAWYSACIPWWYYRDCRAYLVKAKENSITPPFLHIYPTVRSVRDTINDSHSSSSGLRFDEFHYILHGRAMTEKVRNRGKGDQSSIGGEERFQIGQIESDCER